MLQFSPVRSNADTKRYYGGADYYAEDRPSFRAQGQLAEELGLAGPLTHEELCSLFDKIHPHTGEKLCQRRKDNAIACTDATFSPPKSFVIMAQVAGDDRLLDLHERVVSQILDWMEPDVQVRERKGLLWDSEARKTVGNMLAVTTSHYYTRPVEGEPDPGMHTHALLFNIARDGKAWKAADFHDIVKASEVWRAAYHAELAAGARDLGYQTRETKHGFELAGVGEAVIRKFSRRSDQVEKEHRRRISELTERIEQTEDKGLRKELQDHLRKISGKGGKSYLGAKTREPKQAVHDPEKLKASWWDRLTPNESASLHKTLHAAQNARPSVKAPKDREHAAATLERLLAAHSAVPEERLIAETLKSGVGEVSLPGVRAAIEAMDVIRDRVPEKTGPVYATTTEALTLERSVLRKAERGGIRVQRLGKDEQPTPRPDETVLRSPTLLALADASQSPDKLLVTFPLRDYRAADRGNPNVFLEDIAGLRCGQDRPKPKAKLAAKAITVGKRIGEKVKRHIRHLQRLNTLKGFFPEDHDGRQVETLRQRGGGIER